MVGFKQRKKSFAFGIVHDEDDRDIEVRQMRRESRRGLWSEGARFFRDILFILAIFVLLGVFVVQPVVVEGTSMLSGIHDGERLIVNKLVYYQIESVSWGHLERGDIVVFWYPKNPEKSYVKRVIGLPGETVEMRNGVVYIDGERMLENYLDPEHNKSKMSFEPRFVENHYYFVLGDNRDNSSDSRYWGPVPEKYIYGKVFFRYWSPSNAGFLHRGLYDLDEDKLKNLRAKQPDDINEE